MTARIVLIGMSPQIQGAKWDFTGHVRIGRQPASDLVLQHPSIHHQHAEIFSTPRGWMIRDLSQVAGSTLVNGLTVSQTPRRLQKKDVLHCGKLELQVSDIQEEAPPAMPISKGPANIKTTGPIVCIKALSQRSWEQSLYEVKHDQEHLQQGKQFLTLLQGGHYLARLHNASDFFQAFLDDTLAVLSAQRAALVLFDTARQTLQLRTVAMGKGISRGGRCFSTTLAKHCFFKGESVLCQDAAREKAMQGMQSAIFSDMGSILCMVLRTPRRKLGILHFDRGPLQESFSPEDFSLAETIVASVSAAIESALTVEKQYAQLARQGSGLAKLLLATVDANLVERAERVSQLAGRIGEELRLEPDEKQPLELAALLLHLGKAPLPLPGEGSPSSTCHGGTQAHQALRAAAALAAVPGLEQLAPLVRNHQEKWNGSGLPDSLAEQDIPRLARILAVAQSLDDKLHPEAGQAPLTRQQATDWFKARAGLDFDPECVEALVNVMARLPG